MLHDFDKRFRNNKITFLAGVDEAGRGPLAGPVVAAAVVFNPDTIIESVDDSKKLSAKKRDELYVLITSQALSFAVSIIDHKEIDRINILQASLRAMSRAVAELNHQYDLILIDGNKSFESKVRRECIVRGDSRSFSIAAASIIAKVTRDRLMIDLGDKYPEYNWKKNKGYGTREHIAAIHKHGTTPYHRKSFLGKILGENSPNFL